LRARWPDWANFSPIGWLFTLGIFSINYRTNTNFGTTFSQLTSYVSILTKNGLGNIFGEFFHKLIWSPWLPAKEKNLLKPSFTFAPLSSNTFEQRNAQPKCSCTPKYYICTFLCNLCSFWILWRKRTHTYVNFLSCFKKFRWKKY
jgi:hypothetical protein